MAHPGAHGEDIEDRAFSAIRWGAALDCGIGAIDTQHRALIALIDRFETEHAAGHSTQALDDALPQFASYALRHFHDEEELMKTLVGEDAFVRIHIAQHAEFFSKIRQLSADRQAHTDSDTAQALVRYLRNWLFQHIATTDAVLSNKLLEQYPLLATR